MSQTSRYDVAVVGASLAGCAAARLFAQRGLSVALIDQHPSLDWHKRLCTHYIQACAVEAVQRLGLEPLIEAAGGVRSRMEIWARWGWIKHPPDSPPETYGYSIRRQTLDPIVRRLAADTPGVELLLGWKAYELLRDGDRFAGVRLRDQGGTARDVSARLVVAADGRSSPLAEMAQVPLTTKPNNRFTYYAYFRGMTLASGRDSQLWMLDPDVAYALACDDGLALLAVWITKDKLDAFRGDLERSFDLFVRSLPEGPDFSQAQRVSEILGSIDLPVLSRPKSRPGLALIGDAALASDPLCGVGCGWAFQSAEWLVDCTAGAFASPSDREIDRALKRYARRHCRELGLHNRLITGYARGKRFSAMERLFHCAAARDAKVADRFLGLSSRRMQPYKLVRPSMIARALRRRLFGSSAAG